MGDPNEVKGLLSLALVQLDNLVVLTLDDAYQCYSTGPPCW